MKQLIVLVILSVLLTNCNNQQVDNTKNAPLDISFLEKEFSGNKIIYEEDTLFAKMSYKYPVFSGFDSTVTNRINDFITSLLLSDYSVGPDNMQQKPKSLAEIAEYFFYDAQEATSEEYPYTGAWYYQFDTDTLLIDDATKRLTLIHQYSTYTGGAHPNYYFAISNFDLNTGDTLSNDLLFNNDEILIAAAEKRFIENEQKVLSENGYEFNLQDYWFENESFHLPQAIGFTREGVRCIYSPYEISSYARGAIDFTIPYEDVPHLMP